MTSEIHDTDTLSYIRFWMLRVIYLALYSVDGFVRPVDDDTTHEEMGISCYTCQKADSDESCNEEVDECKPGDVSRYVTTSIIYNSTTIASPHCIVHEYC